LPMRYMLQPASGFVSYHSSDPESACSGDQKI
jgi:hypothetical protein